MDLLLGLKSTIYWKGKNNVLYMTKENFIFVNSKNVFQIYLNTKEFSYCKLDVEFFYYLRFVKGYKKWHKIIFIKIKLSDWSTHI